MLLQNWFKNFATFLISFLVNCCGSVLLFFFFRPSFLWIVFLIPSLSHYYNLSFLEFRSHSLSFSFSVTPSLFICLFISHHLDHSLSHAHATPHSPHSSTNTQRSHLCLRSFFRPAETARTDRTHGRAGTLEHPSYRCRAGTYVQTLQYICTR